MTKTPDSLHPKCPSLLIIEDEKDIRESLQQALEFEGYNVSSAENGQEALRLLNAIQGPCLILLDLMMPIMNGWEFLDALKDDHILATIPVVIVSAYSDRAKTVKASGFVKKPIDLDILFRIVKKYCN